MMDWWTHRSGRGKRLLLTGGAVVACFAMYFAVIEPISSYKASSLRSYVAAQSELRTVNDLVAELKSTKLSRPEAADRLPRVEATAVARDMGLGITRIQPMQDGSISFWFDEAAAPDIFRWLIKLKSTHGFDVKRADIQKVSEADTVRAQIILWSPQ